MSEAPPTRRSLEETAEAAAEAFRQRVGRPPEGVWGAPGRVNLIGEHTDYNKGFVLPIAINRHVVAAIARRADHRLRLWSLQEEEGAELALSEVGPGTVRGWAAYPAGVAWSLAREGIPIGGFELVLHGTVPVASGLSSSAAVECAVAVGLAELHGVPLDPTGLALAAHRAEVEVAGVPCGVMDQMATMLAKSGHALFLDTLSLRFEHVPLDLASARLTLLVINTRASRRLVGGAYAARRADCEAAALALGVRALRDASLEDLEAAASRLDRRTYRYIRHVVTENGRVLHFVELLHERRFDRLGPLLTASHESLRDDFEVSSPELDAAVESALEAGAVGARMTGAGFGGCALALVPEELVGQTAELVTEAFRLRRLRSPQVFMVSPADGAARVR